MPINVTPIIDINENIEVGPYETKFLELTLDNNAFKFTIADFDENTQELCLRAWFTELEPYDRIVRYPDFTTYRAIQRNRPLKIAIHTNLLMPDNNTVNVPQGKYFMNVQNVSGRRKFFTVKVE